MSEGGAGTADTLTQHELFWIEVIRAASNDTDPIPTLERTQKLRLLFSSPASRARRPEDK